MAGCRLYLSLSTHCIFECRNPPTVALLELLTQLFVHVAVSTAFRFLHQLTCIVQL